MEELSHGAVWSKAGSRVTTPPIRVPVEDGKLACAIGVAGPGQSVPRSWAAAGTELPTRIAQTVNPIRDGQGTATPTFYALTAEGEHRPLVTLRVSGWDRDLRHPQDSLFDVDVHLAHRRSDGGEVTGWMEIELAAVGSKERLRVESIDPSSTGLLEYRGTVRGDVFVPVADAVLAEGSRARHRVRKREAFVLELDEGGSVEVDPSEATLEGVDTERTTANWREIAEQFGAFLVFPEVDLQRRDDSSRFTLSERVVCDGDRVTVRGRPRVAEAGTGSGYRETGASVDVIEAADIEVDDPVARGRERLTTEERAKYRVDDPPEVPERPDPIAEMHRDRAERAALEKRMRPRRLAFAIAVVVAIGGILGVRFYFLARGETNTFTRVVDALGEGE